MCMLIAHTAKLERSAKTVIKTGTKRNYGRAQKLALPCFCCVGNMITFGTFFVVLF